MTNVLKNLPNGFQKRASSFNRTSKMMSIFSFYFIDSTLSIWQTLWLVLFQMSPFIQESYVVVLTIFIYLNSLLDTIYKTIYCMYIIYKTIYKQTTKSLPPSISLIHIYWCRYYFNLYRYECTKYGIVSIVFSYLRRFWMSQFKVWQNLSTTKNFNAIQYFGFNAKFVDSWILIS